MKTVKLLPYYCPLVIQPLSTGLINSNFCFDLSHWRSTTVSLESSNSFIALLGSFVRSPFHQTFASERSPIWPADQQYCFSRQVRCCPVSWFEDSEAMGQRNSEWHWRKHSFRGVFLNDCRITYTVTKVITPTNHNRSKQHDEPIRIPRNYMPVTYSKRGKNHAYKVRLALVFASRWLKNWREIF